jgi:hypothetical protein
MPHFKKQWTFMKAQLITFLLLFTVCKGMAQTYFVNDIVNEIELTKLMQTKEVFGQNIVFIENKFKLIVSKEDLLKALKVDARQSSKDYEKIYNVVIDYISSTDSLTFEYIWSNANDFDDISWFETDKLGQRNLTKKVLKETVCGLIEKGNFEVFQNNQKESNYFFERVDSNYGGNVKGVFTVNKRLIWICPPFIID